MVAARQYTDSDLVLLRERRRRRAVGQPYHPTVEGFTAATRITVPQATGSVAVPFVLWPAQVGVLRQMEQERLLIILKARQLGISWLACAYALYECTIKAGQVWLLFSQGQLEANILIRRIRFMFTNHAELARLPRLVTDNTSELAWSNGSGIISLPSTKRAGRSFTASGVMLDERAFMQYGQELQEAVAPTINDGGKLFEISSADGNGSEYHQEWQAAETGASLFKPIFLPWQANPTRPADFRDKLLDGTRESSGVYREYPENAIEAFTHAAGLIFDNWRDGPDDGNVSEAADYVPDGGMILYAIDDGYVGSIDPVSGHYTANSHPRVFLFCQLRPTGQLCVFAEHYAVTVVEDQHIEQVLQEPYPEPDFAVVDKSAAQLRGRLQAIGIYTRNGPSSVDESIKELRRWIAKDGNDRRRLLVHPRCRHLRFEFTAYRYDDNERPVKAHDHGIDAIRYLCWNLRHEG